MSEQRIIFNSSLPRAGSTLLQNILAQNPRVYSSPTSGLVDILFAGRHAFTTSVHIKAQDANVMRTGWAACARGLLYGWYEGVTDQPICVDKSRNWIRVYEWLTELIPDTKMLVCIRDLRAILSSMEKLHRKNKHLADPTVSNPKDPMSMATMAHRVANWLQGPPVGTAMTAVINAVQTGIHRKMHFVRYEDLTAHPKETMKKVYEYLGEPDFEHDFDRVEQKTIENDAMYPIYGDHSIRDKVAPLLPDYQEVFGKELCAHIKQGNSLFYQTFYSAPR